MKNILLEKEAKRKQESRDIVKEMLNFGITEQQKIDIMFFLSMTLENNSALKEITSVLKKFKTDINKMTENNYKDTSTSNKKLIL